MHGVFVCLHVSHTGTCVCEPYVQRRALGWFTVRRMLRALRRTGCVLVGCFLRADRRRSAAASCFFAFAFAFALALALAASATAASSPSLLLSASESWLLPTASTASLSASALAAAALRLPLRIRRGDGLVDRASVARSPAGADVGTGSSASKSKSRTQSTTCTPSSRYASSYLLWCCPANSTASGRTTHLVGSVWVAEIKCPLLHALQTLFVAQHLVHLIPAALNARTLSSDTSVAELIYGAGGTAGRTGGGGGR